MARKPGHRAKQDKKLDVAIRLRISRDRLRILRRDGEAEGYMQEVVEYAALIGEWERML